MIDLAKLVNGKLLPELRKLGIPCPNHPCHVLQPATEYHSFCITTTNYTCNEIKTVSAGLCLSNIIPATIDLPELGIDVGAKVFELEDPELFQRALVIITTRWRAMQRYEDYRILSYIEKHSHSERTLFSQHHINRLLELSGHEPNTAASTTMDIPWISLPYKRAIQYINQARHNLLWKSTS